MREMLEMPRTPRVFLDRAFYHVYGSLARGERIFADEREAARFVDIVHNEPGQREPVDHEGGREAA